jgi:hypothetical protein
MLTHPEIRNDDGTLVPFHLQSTIDHVLWLRSEIAKSKAMRAGMRKET